MLVSVRVICCLYYSPGACLPRPLSSLHRQTPRSRWSCGEFASDPADLPLNGSSDAKDSSGSSDVSAGRWASRN